MTLRLPALAATLALTAAGVLLASGTAGATTTAPPLAHSKQTIYFHHNKTSAGFANSAPITFTEKTFRTTMFGDSGTFTNVGNKLTLTITKSRTGSMDAGCAFKGTYSVHSNEYKGTYVCPGGYHSRFAVTTTG